MEGTVSNVGGIPKAVFVVSSNGIAPAILCIQDSVLCLNRTM